MKNNIAKIAALSVIASSVLMASGWRLPEQSAKSLALSNAYVANANGADSSYFNPANMSFNKDAYQFEMDLMYVGLSKIKYTDTFDPRLNGETKKENFIIPTMFFTTKDYNGFRFGFSTTAPGGLSKRWDSPYQKAFADHVDYENL